MKRYQVSAIPTMVIVNRPHIQSDLLEKSSHLKYVGIIIINTGITINVQLNSARVTTRSNDKRLVFELLEELSKSRAVANATEMAPAVAVTNPSIKNVPSDTNDVCLFMKGVPDAPQCGFSMTVSNILKHLNVNFKGVNVLDDQNLRQGIKEFSDWPTIPQLYIKGEFIGGCDIVKEMFENGELKNLLEGKKLI